LEIAVDGLEERDSFEDTSILEAVITLASLAAPMVLVLIFILMD